MNVLMKKFGNDMLIPIETSLEDRRIVFVEGEINQEKADEFAKEVMHLAMEDMDKPIKVIINSEGGEIDAGLKMCDIVAECPCTVDAYCFGRAYSMAAVLFESVNGKRYMVGHSKLMMHQPSVYGLKSGTAGEIEEISNQMKEKNELLLSIVSKRCGMSLAKLKRETEKDRYFDADEAIKAGLSDEVISFADLL